MLSISDLLKICQKHKIDIWPCDLPKNQLGFYIGSFGHSFILMSPKIATRAQYKCILAEEIGHFYTCPGGYDVVHRKEEKRRVQQVELDAHVWAFQTLMPFNEVWNIIFYFWNGKFISKAVIAILIRKYDVTEKFVVAYLRAYRCELLKRGLARSNMLRKTA